LGRLLPAIRLLR